MPDINYDIRLWEPSVGVIDGEPDLPFGYVDVDHVGIRQPDPNLPERHNRFAPVLDSAVFTTQHHALGDLTEVFGVDFVVGTEGDEEYVGIQVSLDNGTTYLAWDGAAWVAEAEGGDYSSMLEFNDNCASLPLVNPQYLGFRVKLVKTSDDRSPLLYKLLIMGEFDHHFHLDTFKAMKGVVDDLAFPVELKKRQGVDSATLTLNDKYTPRPSPSFEIFDLTLDPSRNANLFSAYNPATRLITMTRVVLGDSVLLIRFLGSCEAVLAKKDELITLGKLPVTVLRMGEQEEPRGADYGRLIEIRRNTSMDDSRARIREQPRLLQVKVTVEHWTPTRQTSLRSYRALREAFSNITSPGTGQVLALHEDETSKNSDATDSFNLATWSGTVTGFEYSRHYEEVRLAHLTVRAFNRGREWFSEGIQ